METPLEQDRTDRKIKTRFLVISDTHGRDSLPHEPADVAIHCGDLTRGSKLDEFRAAIHLLEQLDAPLKLVIAGNHDFTLDIPTFQAKTDEAWRLQQIDPFSIEQEYGYHGQVEELFAEARNSGIRLLTEGTYRFTLSNGASLTVYASPFTPEYGDWGFQYPPQQGHTFAIGQEVDVVMTHGPPRGILDITQTGQRAGCARLFEAVARARPLMHCFGHVHPGWGARMVAWRKVTREKPSHLSDIDNGRSVLVEKLSNIKDRTIRPSVYRTSHCADDIAPIQPGINTLFVNAAIEGSDGCRDQPPWMVAIDLAKAGED